VPNAAGHSRAVRITALLLCPAPAILPVWVGVGVVTGALIGFVTDPDLDLGHLRTRAQQEMYRAGGDMVGWLWTKYWKPYGRMIRHASYWSHGYVVGTALRLAYAAPLWGPVCMVLSYFMGPEQLLPAVLGVFLGLCVQDGIHVFLDWVF